MTKKGWKALNRKIKGGAHADMVSEGFANFIAKGDRLANSRDVNPLETIWIIVNEMTYNVIHTCITTFATIRKITHS